MNIVVKNKYPYERALKQSMSLIIYFTNTSVKAYNTEIRLFLAFYKDYCKDSNAHAAFTRQRGLIRSLKKRRPQSQMRKRNPSIPEYTLHSSPLSRDCDPQLYTASAGH